MKFRAVLFDAAETLFTTRGSVGEIYGSIARKYGSQASSDTIQDAFRRHFRGREDVYARAWAQKKGYSPARSDGRLLPLTDAVLLDHLRGRHVVGVYPLLVDNTCWFLAVDFDGDGWLEDVMAFSASYGVSAFVRTFSVRILSHQLISV